MTSIADIGILFIAIFFVVDAFNPGIYGFMIPPMLSLIINIIVLVVCIYGIIFRRSS